MAQSQVFTIPNRVAASPWARLPSLVPGKHAHASAGAWSGGDFMNCDMGSRWSAWNESGCCTGTQTMLPRRRFGSTSASARNRMPTASTSSP